MPNEDQCCGECRWWRAIGELGRCKFPLPVMPLSMPKPSLMDRREGTDCPCFERKEAAGDGHAGQ